MQAISGVAKKKAAPQLPSTAQQIEPIEGPMSATQTLMDNPIEEPGASKRKPRGMIGMMGVGRQQQYGATRTATGGLL